MGRTRVCLDGCGVTYSLAVLTARCGPEAAQWAFGALTSLQVQGAKLLLFTDHKFDGRGSVTVRNTEAGYPAATIEMRNNAVMAEASVAPSRPDYRIESYELFCLEQAMRNEGCDCIVLLRARWELSERDIEWLEKNKSEPYRILGAGAEHESYAFDCRLRLTRNLITVAADFYRSAAVLALSNPSLASVLRLVSDALSCERLDASSMEPQ